MALIEKYPELVSALWTLIFLTWAILAQLKATTSLLADERGWSVAYNYLSTTCMLLSVWTVFNLGAK